MLAGPASAITTWTLSTGSVSGNNSSVTAASTGWANTIGSGSAVNSYTLESQTLTAYSGGLGIANNDGCSSASNYCDVGDQVGTAPEHSVDNEQRYEMQLVSFNNNVDLKGVTFGWTGTSNVTGGDSDFTVLAYNGAGAPTFAGKTWSDIGAAASGWTKIGSYANATSGVLQTINTSDGVFLLLVDRRLQSVGWHGQGLYAS